MATLATRMAFGEELIEIGKTNENFVVCNADTKTCGLDKFGKLFPEREFSFGIAEQNLVSGAAGLEDVVITASADAPAQDAVSEAMLALKSLGYTPQEAANALKGVKGQADTADELIRLALRHMAQNG